MLRYWYEARKRLIFCVAYYLVAWLIGALSYQALYACLESIWQPSVKQVLLTDVRSGVMLPWKIAGAFALWISVPLWVHQLVGFVSPALYDAERYRVYWTAVVATVLFMVGTLLGLWFVMPWLLVLAKQFMPQGLLFLPSMDTLISLSQQMAIMCGLVLEMPLVMYQLLLNEWVNVRLMQKQRGIWVSGIFFVSMLLTPPDVISQLCLALPLWAMIEFVIYLYLWMHHRCQEVV